MYYTKSTNEYYSIVNYKLPTFFKLLPFDKQVYWSGMRNKNKCLVNNKLYAKWKTLLKKNNMTEQGKLINNLAVDWPKKVLRYINRNANNFPSK